jgi:hypothetical protein
MVFLVVARMRRAVRPRIASVVRTLDASAEATDHHPAQKGNTMYDPHAETQIMVAVQDHEINPLDETVVITPEDREEFLNEVYQEDEIDLNWIDDLAALEGEA